MSRSHSVYICQQCDYHSSTYLGKCPQCDAWNSFVEQIESRVKGQGSRKDRSRLSTLAISDSEIINLADIQKTDYKRLNTGFEEFDRVLGGGIVQGSLVLVSGDPGIGKSTLLTQLALNINQGTTGGKGITSATGADKTRDTRQPRDASVLYVAGEESAQQIKIRADRIQPGVNLAVLNETDVDVICETIRQGVGTDLVSARPTKGGHTGLPLLVIIDSIQTLETQDLESVAGSVGQVRECAHRLQRLAKDLHIPIFLVGHVTKEGNIAGPKTLEHVVDVVVSLEGDPASFFRILRSTKNRFGPTDEVGVFEMEEQGMKEVKNPSKIFLEQKVNAPGSAVVAVLTGIRPLLVEVQALVTKTALPVPRRTGVGIDNNKLQLLSALLQSRMKLPLYDRDIFVNVTGGLKINEPAVDLGVCLAIISSFKDQNIAPGTVIFGEVGLLGEVRAVRGPEKRVAEAKKLGFSNVISPENVKNLAQAVKLALR